jgi:DNA-binding CsgD family transcriptional regulator
LARVAAHLLACGPAGDGWWCKWRAGQPDAISHLEQALAAGGKDPHLDRELRVPERLALMIEASIAIVEMVNERTAPAALRRAETLRGRLNPLADPVLRRVGTAVRGSACGNRGDPGSDRARPAAWRPGPTAGGTRRLPGVRWAMRRLGSLRVRAGRGGRLDAITGRDALTAGELTVARLAAEGLTNREIAQALFTTKTVKAHLSRVHQSSGLLAAASSPIR